MYEIDAFSTNKYSIDEKINWNQHTHTQFDVILIIHKIYVSKIIKYSFHALANKLNTIISHLTKEPHDYVLIRI